MRIEVYTSAPAELLNEMKEQANLWGKLYSWGIVKDVKDRQYFTHASAVWKKKALFLPSVSLEQNKIVFRMSNFRGSKKPDDAIKGYYIGKFAEQLMVAFGDSFDKMEIVRNK